MLHGGAFVSFARYISFVELSFSKYVLEGVEEKKLWILKNENFVLKCRADFILHFKRFVSEY